jgi:hypothetical protein
MKAQLAATAAGTASCRRRGIRRELGQEDDERHDSEDRHHGRQLGEYRETAADPPRQPAGRNGIGQRQPAAEQQQHAPR